MTYVAGIEESHWQVQASPVRCELRHDIPRYGEGRFVYSAGGELAFEISVFDPPVRDGVASMISVPPFWKLENVNLEEVGNASAPPRKMNTWPSSA